MIFNGKEFAQKVKNELKEEFSKLAKKPELHIVSVGDDPSSKSYLRMKIRSAEDVGAGIVIHHFSDDILQEELLKEVKRIAADPDADGIIVQLPLPAAIDTELILNAIPPEKDPDILSERSWNLFESEKISLIPPTPGAMIEILHKNNITLKGKNVVILGRKRLIGKPIRICAEREKANITVLHSGTGDPTPYLLKADIILCGANKPHIVKPEMIKKDAVIVDGGTCELDGKIVGNADPACAEKCALFTPVPGGVGPVTAVVLFQNLAELIREKREKETKKAA
ncbi:MAG: bifunctional 5,10-methylenetetrahydrofolate dehydrogenase/5,10-methenyltetrahydrofolate cyclohydrolase [Candidatus Paceibacterota bacterium]|jgi:methylenetetrahydrofolate dehydrogenase (NADP+)/methenyltetrahydrofolate cyclohydrolase|nr:bifunctional 5,10-methylenetetrahydrofolate dehydrogenase/5,10-methenyltetrahydrofolate cyclohydrolase [Candidatus Paceibacterota bacterium]